MRFVGPYITVCNYFNYSWTHVAEHLTEPDPTGGSQRTLLNQAGRQDNSVTSLGAAEPANGENVRSGTPQFLHSNNYSAAVDNEGNADCESGQRGYVERQNVYGDKRFKTVVDPHTPGQPGHHVHGPRAGPRRPDLHASARRARGPQDPAGARPVSRLSPFAAGLLALIVIAVGTYFGFTKSNPFADRFEFTAAFRSANDLKVKSPVRVAGVQVGKVTKIEPVKAGGPDGEGAIVTMEIDDKGLPLHEDARLKIRPRIFLEGNWFVEVQAGLAVVAGAEGGRRGSPCSRPPRRCSSASC